MSSGDDAPSTVVSARERPKKSGADLRAVAPAITILWHYDLARVGRRATLTAGGSTEVSRFTSPFDAAADVVLSRQPFLFVEHQDGVVVLRPGATRTTVMVDGAPLTAPVRIQSTDLSRGVILTLADQIVVCLHQLNTPVLRGPTFGFVGNSDAMEGVRRQIAKVANLDIPVHIRGESGTGKELVAQAIAANAAAPGPFVAINMGTIPAAMAAAELFGHEKGAFTGALEPRPGYFVQADGGILFLDEIASALLDVQKNLLRVLQDSEVRPVGARRAKTVKVRVLTATDKDLQAAVANGTFDGPLLARISKYQIELPPLRTRREDLGALFLHFLRESLSTTDELDRLAPTTPEERPWLNAPDFARIAASSFPGNVRTLSSIASQLAISSRGHPYAKFDSVLQKILSGPGAGAMASAPLTVAQVENALRKTAFAKSAAAAMLGVPRFHLYQWLDSHPGIARKADEIPDAQLLEADKRHAGRIVDMALELRVSPKPLKHRLDEIRTRRS